MKGRISFSQPLPTTISRLKQLGIIIAIATVSAMVLAGINSFSELQLKTKQQIEDNVLKAEAEYKKQCATLSKKESRLLEIGNLTSKLMDKDNFVTFLGRATDAADVTIVSLESGGSLSTDSVTSVNFKFELKGKLANVKQIVTAIDSLNTTYNIRQMSLRKDGKYLWLNRNTGSKSSSWFQFEQGKNPSLNPQNIPLPESLPEVVLNEKGEIIEIKDKRLTSVDDLMNEDDVTLYLDISFLIAR